MPERDARADEAPGREPHPVTRDSVERLDDPLTVTHEVVETIGAPARSLPP
jgi:hypothetical protein